MSEHVMGVMRYFIEVTEGEATAMEGEGRAKVMLGASGGADSPRFFGTSCAWILLGTTELRAARKREREEAKASGPDSEA